jgi:hypothetical protein
MSEITSRKVNSDIMPKKDDAVNTGIRVPREKYELLEEIKKAERKPIKALVLEGIDLVLLKYEDILTERIISRADNVKKVLAEVKTESKKEE